ncbi:hypothetical protein N7495_001653 [Penicillium taxi]|uniref:uncharacterized protein n=1 Tax=Penicillium taxi TaxID=168475 RepID=UPI002544D961|nr:uncharacterized protein N7495_001653 [Penicillium taxi]KAJ5908971.1 hypothetical protein N7495_001653 [Penicillium taxi]
MAKIHKARKMAGRDANLHGILTDAKTWTFLHLTNDNKYSERILHWNGERDQIYGLVQTIVDAAIDSFRDTVEPRLSRNSQLPTVSRISGYTIRNIPDPKARATDSKSDY